MEIKTLEHYVITLLDSKDDEIKELETENAELLLSMREYKQKYETLVSILSKNGEFHRSETHTWYDFTVWNDDADYGLIESIFKDIVRHDDEDKQGETV